MNKNYNHLALALLRIGFAAVMLTHGFPKFKMLISSPSDFPMNPIGIGAIPTLVLAVIGEFIAPLLIIAGFKTRIATIPTILTMATAILVVHADDPFHVKEKAILFLIGFVAVALAGPGKYSIDKK